MSKFKKNVLFLDVDGPIASERSIHAQGYERDTIKGWDIVSCKLINGLAVEFDYTLVVSSTWAMYGFKKVKELLSEAGITAPIHGDWCTPRKRSSTRGNEINWWLDDHAEIERVVVIDDVEVELRPAPRRKDLVLYINSYEGFSWADLVKVYNFHEEKPPVYL